MAVAVDEFVSVINPTVEENVSFVVLEKLFIAFKSVKDFKCCSSF